MTHPDPLDWLLEEDPVNPGARYFALKDLLNLPETDTRVRQARKRVMLDGPVPAILAAQHADGYWEKSGGGYSPKYRATTWSLLFLAELGADGGDRRVQAGCGYVLEHSLAGNGAFAARQSPTPAAAYHCLNGNMLSALTRLGFSDDPRVEAAYAWLARSILGQAPITYYASGVTGPGFGCGVNLAQPCGWGANKAMRAMLELPDARRTPLVKRAVDHGAEFLLSRDPVTADYPYTERVSSTWFKLGFPLSYWSDVLETVANLVRAGHGTDERLVPALDWLEDKRGDDGRWKLENSLTGKMWVNIERKGQPSKWVTLRALRALKGAGRYSP